MSGITLITVTGDRPEAFRLCEFWISRQTYVGPLQWIVVDDGQVPTAVRRGQQYIRREPQKRDPRHTMCANLRLAWKHVQHDKILIIEDDDYYAPSYIDTMAGWLDEAELVGEIGAKYYFVQTWQSRVFTEHQHASLCRSGFRRSVLGLVQRLTRDDNWQVDLQMWMKWNGSKKLVRESADHRAISVSMKGMPGRVGVTHRVSPTWIMEDDSNLAKLKTWLGSDHEYYLPYLGRSQGQLQDLQVYTVCIGGYDRLRPQPVQDGVSYTALTDGQVVLPWTKIEYTQANGIPRRASRRPKILAHEYFPAHATTMYVDANVKLSDPLGLAKDMIQSRPEAQLFLLHHNMRRSVIEEADVVTRIGFDDKWIVHDYMRRYNGLPDSSKHLAWGGCILRRPGCELFNRTWWEEYCSGSVRDQLSLPYALHRSGITYCLRDIPFPINPGEQSEWLEFSRHVKARRRRS